MFRRHESVSVPPCAVERRAGGDRRTYFRGGRRASDLARAAAMSAMPLTLIASMAVPSAQSPQSRPPRDTSAMTGRRAVPRDPVPAKSKKVPAPAPEPAPAPAPEPTPAPAPEPTPAPAPVGLAPMRFGLPVAALSDAASHGVSMNYGVLWTGAWAHKWGWTSTEEKLQSARARGVTPIVHWWYWGDEISPDCVERGCQDVRNDVWKDRTAWYRMTRELGAVIEKTMGGRETIVIVETEFNKNGIENYEPFDGYLLDQIIELRRVPGVKVILGFGNWGLSAWPRFDRAAAAADMVGTQLLRSSVRDAKSYLSAVDTLVSGATHLRNTFRKPSFIVDLALSSYPAAEYEAHQEAMVRSLFERVNELKQLGVTGIVWRALVDDPDFDTSNYHGIAERHWGFVTAAGVQKPAFRHLVDGIRAETLRQFSLR